MTQIRTPSSLAWLLKKRARLSGEIIKIEAAEEVRLREVGVRLEALDAQRANVVLMSNQVARSCEQHLAALRRDLEATDQVLRLHEVQIDPDLIAPIQTHIQRAATDYGEMTRLILACLKHGKNRPQSTTQVTNFLINAIGSTGHAIDYSDFRYRVRKRLQRLTREGQVKRHHSPRTTVEGMWLPANAIVEI